MPINRGDNEKFGVSILECVTDWLSQCGSSVAPALLEHALDLFGRDQRASSIVNSDVFRISLQMIQTGANRILTVFSTRDDRPNLFEIFLAEARCDLIEPIFARNDNDPRHANGALKCTYGMGDD